MVLHFLCFIAYQIVKIVFNVKNEKINHIVYHIYNNTSKNK